MRKEKEAEDVLNSHFSSTGAKVGKKRKLLKETVQSLLNSKAHPTGCQFMMTGCGIMPAAEGTGSSKSSEDTCTASGDDYSIWPS